MFFGKAMLSLLLSRSWAGQFITNRLGQYGRGDPQRLPVLSAGHMRRHEKGSQACGIGKPPSPWNWKARRRLGCPSLCGFDSDVESPSAFPDGASRPTKPYALLAKSEKTQAAAYRGVCNRPPAPFKYLKLKNSNKCLEESNPENILQLLLVAQAKPPPTTTT